MSAGPTVPARCAHGYVVFSSGEFASLMEITGTKADSADVPTVRTFEHVVTGACPECEAAGVPRVFTEMTGLLTRVCSYCNTVMGYKPCLPEHDGAETHGICPTCFSQERWRGRK